MPVDHKAQTEVPKLNSEKYERAARLAKIAKDQIMDALSVPISQLGAQLLVRTRLDAPRIKDRSRLTRKMLERKWTEDDVFDNCEDFLGLRMVCNNLQDVFRAADLVEKSLKELGLDTRRKDYINDPLPTGYRALHILTTVPVAFGNSSLAVGCEIQIRTLLQDAWARLSREDIYRAKAPTSIQRQLREMSASLADADRLAEDVRVQITRRRGGEPQPPQSPIVESGLAFMFTRAFGEEPPSYLIDWMLAELKQTGVRADALDTVLQDREFLDACRAAYREETRWPADPTRAFEWAVKSLVNGKEATLNLARQHGKSDWDEVDAQYQSEMRSVLPDKWETLEEELDQGGAAIGEIARYFDTRRDCLCGTEMIEYDDFADALLNHYALRGDEEPPAYQTIIDALASSGFEDADGSDLCSTCHYKLSRDD
jgi:putative GTP pyrophosphokinase